MMMMMIMMMTVMMMPVIFEPGGDHGEVEAEAWNSPKMLVRKCWPWCIIPLAWHGIFHINPISADLQISPISCLKGFPKKTIM